MVFREIGIPVPPELAAVPTPVPRVIATVAFAGTTLVVTALVLLAVAMTERSDDSSDVIDTDDAEDFEAVVTDEADDAEALLMDEAEDAEALLLDEAVDFDPGLEPPERLNSPE